MFNRETIESMYKLHATDYETQFTNEDDVLFPGLVPDEILMHWPPVAVFTSEFDFLMKDSEHFAHRAGQQGKLIGL